MTECHAATNRERVITQATRMNPDTLLSDRSQAQRATRCPILSLWNDCPGQANPERQGQVSGCRGLEEEGLGGDC